MLGLKPYIQLSQLSWENHNNTSLILPVGGQGRFGSRKTSLECAKSASPPSSLPPLFHEYEENYEEHLKKSIL